MVVESCVWMSKSRSLLGGVSLRNVNRSLQFAAKFEDVPGDEVVRAQCEKLDFDEACTHRQETSFTQVG